MLQDETGDDNWMDTLGQYWASGFRAGILLREQDWIDAMDEDAAALGVQKPNFEPRATQFVPDMISMIEELIGKGRAYAAPNGDVYYAVREFAGYGSCRASRWTTCVPASAWTWIRTSVTRWISCCGKRPSRASRHGRARGGRGVLAGTSNARP